MAKREIQETSAEAPIVAKFFDGEEFVWGDLPYATRVRWAQEIANRGASVASTYAIQKAKDRLYDEAGKRGKKSEVASDDKVKAIFSAKDAPRRGEFESMQLECMHSWKDAALAGELGEIGVESYESQNEKDRLTAMERTVNEIIQAVNAKRVAENASLPKEMPKQKMLRFYAPLATGKGSKETNDEIKAANKVKTLAKLAEYDAGSFKQADLFERHLQAIRDEREAAREAAKARAAAGGVEEVADFDALEDSSDMEQAAQ